MLNSIKELQYLTELETLSIKNSTISDIQELSEPLACLSKLKSINVSDSEFTSFKKYRDFIILGSASVETIDDKPVTKQERQFITKLTHLKSAKSKIGRSSSTGNIEQLPKPVQHVPQPPKLPPKLAMLK